MRYLYSTTMYFFLTMCNVSLICLKVKYTDSIHVNTFIEKIMFKVVQLIFKKFKIKYIIQDSNQESMLNLSDISSNAETKSVTQNNDIDLNEAIHSIEDNDKFRLFVQYRRESH